MTRTRIVHCSLRTVAICTYRSMRLLASMKNTRIHTASHRDLDTTRGLCCHCFEFARARALQLKLVDSAAQLQA
jgi:hypothetical protein